MSNNKALCLICGKPIRDDKKYNVLKSGPERVEIACLFEHIKQNPNQWKLKSPNIRGNEKDKDKVFGDKD